jgi:protein-disulfide isomerase
MGTSVKGILEVGASAMMLAAGGVVLWTTLERRPPGRPTSPTLVGTSVAFPTGHAVLGASNAAAGMIVFSDFECPYCKQFAESVLPNLRQRYVEPGRVRLAFKHFPLPNHPRARDAAIAAECAGRNGLFWEIHDLLFAAGPRLDDDVIRRSAVAVNLGPAFESCLAGPGSEAVDLESKDAQALQLTGTPTILIGRLERPGYLRVVSHLVGNKPLVEFDEALNAVTQR